VPAGAANALGYTREPSTFEGVESHVEVGETMVDGAKQPAHLYLNVQLFADLSTQAAFQLFTRAAFSPRELPQSAEHGIEGALRDQEPIFSVPDDARSDVAMRALFPGCSNGELLLDAFGHCLAEPDERADQAAWMDRQADARSEIHQGLVQVTGMAWGKHAVGKGDQASLSVGTSRIIVDGKDATQDAAQIAVKRDGVLAKSDAGDRGGSILADAGQKEEFFGRVWYLPVKLLHDTPGRRMEVACPRIVAKPFPCLEHVGQGSIGQGDQGREACEEALVVGYDGLGAGLLEHDLRNPYGVGVLGEAPGEHSALLIVPLQKPLSEGVGIKVAGGDVD